VTAGEGIAVVVGVGAVGVVGYLGYRWWQRRQLQAALEAQAQAYQDANPGVSWKTALEAIGTGGCAAGAAAAIGIPPAVAGPICAQLVPLLVEKGGPVIAKGARLVWDGTKWLYHKDAQIAGAVESRIKGGVTYATGKIQSAASAVSRTASSGFNTVEHASEGALGEVKSTVQKLCFFC